MLAIVIVISNTFLTVNSSDHGTTIKSLQIAPVKHPDILCNLHLSLRPFL